MTYLWADDAPRSYVATPDQPAVSNKQDAELARLIREARALDPALRDVPKTRLLRMAREFAVASEHDLRDRRARALAASEFGGWLRSNYWKCLRGGLFGRAS